MKKSIILFIALCLPIVAMAQRTLTGKVTDVNNGQPLVGATLFWKNTTAGATSAQMVATQLSVYTTSTLSL